MAHISRMAGRMSDVPTLCAHLDSRIRNCCRTALYWGCLAGMVVLAFGAEARDLGQWKDSDPAVREWYEKLMQPDIPTSSCCAESDAYFCDDVHVKDGRTFCSITDDRSDEPRGRPHRDVGETFEIPPNKLKWDKGNPTGHSIIFLSRSGYVFCFVQGTGI